MPQSHNRLSDSEHLLKVLDLLSGPTFDTLDEAAQRYQGLLEIEEAARFAVAILAHHVSEQSASGKDRHGKAGLSVLAGTAQRKHSTLVAESRVGKIAWLRNGRPTLSFTHFNILIHTEEPQKWADFAAEQDWSPAELRRQIAKSKGLHEDPSVIVKKAESGSDKLMKTADEAVVAGVLPAVAEHVDRVASYVTEKLKEGG